MCPVRSIRPLSDRRRGLVSLQPADRRRINGSGDPMQREPILVVAGVIPVAGRVLIARRRGGPMAGKWEFPGGKVEPGEAPRSALARELREELAVTVAVGPRICTVPFAVAGTRFLLAAYYARRLDGTAVPLDHSGLRWVGPGALLDADLAPADVPVARRVAADLRGSPDGETARWLKFAAGGPIS